MFSTEQPKACGDETAAVEFFEQYTVYTVRTGAIYEDSKLPLRHWAYGFWRVCASKKGVSAREIERNCQITYKSALFLMHRIRFALAEDHANKQKLGNTTGICEVDETFVGGKPRPSDPRTALPGYRKNSNKIPVVAVVERGGHVRTKAHSKSGATYLWHTKSGLAGQKRSRSDI